jgi:hypothetical protein
LGTEDFIEIVTVGDVVRELLTVNDAGAVHAERSEECFLHELVERLSLVLLDDELDEIHAFAGVAELGSRREMEMHLLVGFDEGKVPETRRMGE